MRKALILSLFLGLILSSCSFLDKKPCPPITICPPAAECPPIPEPTPCPPPEPQPTPVPCPECPPPVVCPPPTVCPPEKICPPPVVCPPPTVELPSTAVLLFKPDPKCPPAVTTIVLPAQEKVDCIQREVSKAVKANIHKVQDNGFKLTPGKNSPCYSFFGQMYVNCIDVEVSKVPKLSYGMSAMYLKGSIGATPWEGCAAGVSGDPIRVSLVEDWRVLPLIAWETANWHYWIHFDRLDLADGPYVDQAMKAALAACNL